MSATVRSVTYDLLRKLELTTFFGNPGSTEETFLKDFPADFTYHLALQEASAIAIADGYAQATGKPAIVNVHTAAGLGNAMGNLITASLNKTPLIVTAGQQTREMLLMEPWLTNVDSTQLPRPWVKWAYEPARAEDVPAAFMRAYATAVQAPAGPVFLSLPLDDWDKPFDGPAVVRTVSRRIAPDLDRLEEFADLLSRAANPALIFGAAIDRGHGWSAAVALAEKLDATVWAAPASERAPFPEDHPLYVGGLPFAIGPLSERLKGHDVAIVIGAPVFRYYPYVAGEYLPAGLRLLHISDDPAETARAPVGDSLVGDAVLATRALADLVKARASSGASRPKLSHRMAPHPAAEPKASTGPVPTAAEVFAALAEVRPSHAVLVEESPSNLADLHRRWPITEPATFFTFASGGLGWNLPASVGIALGERDTGRRRPVIMVIGDGSFQYSVQSLWTAAREKLPIVFIVLRNGEYGILKSFAVLEDTPGVPGLDIPGIDIVALAKGYGCTAERITDLAALKAKVAAAFGGDGPHLFEVPIDPSIPPLI
ncbi:Benzoylformate decarboxylase [Starkeya nomas]|uniref:Benzoylformate decarboxylase n=1 Tax=Starkeya nomas TaxID=2666134 RepID=A0A5S9NM87_9HYPH|nr:benzoylformate decarboxylase [Starkeya nomas]CAA0091487.1 Benzoylformate decarboxylase [Starkeya nomas]